jgi:nucleotide-binding universal stress UspA family protein
VTVLVGYRPTPDAQAAVTEAAAEAQRRGVGLRVVHFRAHEAGESPTQVRRDTEASWLAEDALEELRTSLEGRGLAVEVEVRHGLPGEAAATLLAVADEIGADLIVLGMRPRTKLDEIVSGSVLHEVMHRAECPVLAVPATDDPT